MRAALASSMTLLGLLSGCECGEPGGLIVDLRTNFVPGIEFDAVRTEVWGEDDRSPVLEAERSFSWGDEVGEAARVAEAPRLPAGRYTVMGTLLRAGSAIAQRSVIVTLRVSTVVTLLVTRDCRNVICPRGLTCLAGVCVPQDCLDGSAFDGCPPRRCTRDAQCPPFPIECTNAVCLEGQCHPFPDHEACGEAEWCNPDEGCRTRSDPAEDGGTPRDAGGRDGGPPRPCVPGGCDDGNPCTDDVCEASGCVFTPNAEPCDDGIFCNGPDTCAGGSCVAPGTDPCPGASRCNERTDACEGCASDADCPAPTPGPWGSCRFADPCTTTGTRARTVTEYTCVGGTCEGATRSEAGACGRASQDGASCGPTRCEAWSACGWSDPCDERATRTRICTERVCAGGVCADSTRMESEACTRTTGGMSCGAGRTCEAWGPCEAVDECETSGTQSRSCHDFTCGGGFCRDAPSVETRACTRSTEGARCGANPTYCGQVTRCHVCRSGRCVVNRPHYDVSCNPSCGQANALCGASGTCCGSVGTCTPVGGGPFADCVQCCAEGVCL